MPLINHPDAAEEKAHLLEVQSFIRNEAAQLQPLLDEQRIVVKQLTDQAMGDFNNDLFVAEVMLHRMEQRALNMQLAHDKTYFTRVDFIPDNEKVQTHYIGKWGITRDDTLETLVVDWRAPIANLYYSGQIGNVHYTAPDGAVSGELTLKRQLTVEKGELVAIIDAGIAAMDAFFQSILGEMTTGRLREVVSTIQAEQNQIIRHNPDTAVIVQGVAGSGKTTIALHRIAWLLYARRDTLRPANMMILAPNPLFLDYISAVLPELGVDQVRQTTWENLCKSWIGESFPQQIIYENYAARLMMSENVRAREDEIQRFMGSLKLVEYIKAFIREYEKVIIPREEMYFGPVLLFDHAQLTHIFLNELAPLTIAQRIREIPKYYKRRVKEAAAQVQQWLVEQTDKRMEALYRLPDGQERRERAQRLFASRDERLKQTKQQASSYTRKAMKAWPGLDLFELYHEFFNEQPIFALHSGDEDIWRDACAAVAALPKGAARTQDIAPLALLHRLVFSAPREDIRHIVIDEAQDFSPLQYWLLRDVAGNNSFTIVGDLMQGIHSGRGISSWDEINAPIFSGNADRCDLVTSYRNTIEIMEFASRVPRNYGIPHEMLARPVLRHGQPPVMNIYSGAKDRDEFIISQTEKWIGEGFGNIAIICRTDEESANMYNRLISRIDGLQLILPQAQSYGGGLMVISAMLVKGLEFDAVILTDAAQYGVNSLDAPLLYVCLTRPLHRLAVCAMNSMTMLLKE